MHFMNECILGKCSEQAPRKEVSGLVQEIEAAFADTLYPGDHNLCTSGTG